MGVEIKNYYYKVDFTNEGESDTDHIGVNGKYVLLSDIIVTNL